MLRTSQKNQDKLSKGEVPVLSPKGLRAVNEDYFKTMMKAFFDKAATTIRGDTENDDEVRTSAKSLGQGEDNRFLMAEDNGLMKFLRAFK
jgi:hypothetical protein